MPPHYLIRIANEAVRISEEGHYRAPSGRIVHLQPIPDAFDYPPEVPLKWLNGVQGPHQTVVEVTTESTMEAARRLGPCAALNFASAKNPGGGFLRGAVAQEECLARASTLYLTLKGKPYYAAHKRHGVGLYSDHMIYSPKVQFFRDDQHTLLEEPHEVDIITSAAVNCRNLGNNEWNAVGPVMWQRIRRVLALALEHQQTKLVLGAWGCGVFANDPTMIATFFKEHLDVTFRGAFEHVVFAIYRGGIPHTRFQEVFQQP